MTPEEVKEARTLIRPYAKRIREASTGRATVVGHSGRHGDIHEEERGGYFSLALIACTHGPRQNAPEEEAQNQ